MEPKEPRVSSPLTVTLGVCGFHFVVNLVVVTSLANFQQTYFGVTISPGQQALLGAWTLLGFVLIPNAGCAAMFRIAGVLMWYNRYLMVHWCLCFLLSFLSFLHYSPCDAWVPPYVKQDFGVAVVCTCVDAFTAFLVVAFFGLWLFLIRVLNLVSWDLHEEVWAPMAKGYGTFHSGAAKKAKLPAALHNHQAVTGNVAYAAPSQNPFHVDKA